jgi:hypothetical protein
MIRSTRIAVTFVPLILAGCSVSGGQTGQTKTSSSASTTGTSSIKISKNVPAIGETSTFHCASLRPFGFHIFPHGQFTRPISNRIFPALNRIKAANFQGKRLAPPRTSVTFVNKNGSIL